MDNEPTPQSQREEIQKALQCLEVNSEVNEMATRKMGYLLHQRYKILEESGFTKVQAFEIVKHRGLL